MSKLLDLVLSLAEPIAAEHGCRVYETEFKKEGGEYFLRVYLYSPEGITIDQCEGVSRKLSDELDRVDPIDHGYNLEVSSPGLDRALTRDWHFEETIGQKISVKLYSPIEGRKNFSGELLDYKEGIITLKTDEGDLITIDKSKASRVRAVPIFE